MSRRNGPALLVRMDAELLEKFRRACGEDERHLSATVRVLVRKYLAEREGSTNVRAISGTIGPENEVEGALRQQPPSWPNPLAKGTTMTQDTHAPRDVETGSI